MKVKLKGIIKKASIILLTYFIAVSLAGRFINSELTETELLFKQIDFILLDF